MQSSFARCDKMPIYESNFDSDLKMVIENKADLRQVKKFALAAAREYLGGAWKKIDISDFHIIRIM